MTVIDQIPSAAKRGVLRAGFADLYPRTKWASNEFVSVGVSALIALASFGGTYLYGQAQIASIQNADQRINIERREIAGRVAPLRAMNERLKIAEAKAPSILATRQSGLKLAERIVTYGDAIGRDGVATSIDSVGRIEGISPDLASVSRIWGRLGDKVTLTSAKPVNGTIHFSFVQPPMSAAVVVPAPGGTTGAEPTPMPSEPPKAKP